MDLINVNIDKYYSDIAEYKGLKVIYLPNVEIDNYDSEYIRDLLKANSDCYGGLKVPQYAIYKLENKESR